MEHWMLIVDPDIDNFALMQNVGAKHGLMGRKAADMPEALDMLAKDEYVIVYICADRNKFFKDFLKIMRDTTNAPIVVFSLYEIPEQEEINTLRLGADLYTQRHYTNCELFVARSKSLIRRFTELSQEPEALSYITYHDIALYPDYRRAFLRGVELNLRKKEFELLLYFVRNRGRTLPYEKILRNVWGAEYAGAPSNMLRCQVRLLKKQICPHPDSPTYIVNLRNKDTVLN